MAESEVEERALSAGQQPSAFACWAGGHQEGSVQTEAPAGALGSNGAGSAEGSIPAVRIWGPVPKAQAVGAGALAAASSVLIKPTCIPTALIERLHALIPTDADEGGGTGGTNSPPSFTMSTE